MSEETLKTQVDLSGYPGVRVACPHPELAIRAAEITANAMVVCNNEFALTLGDMVNALAAAAWSIGAAVADAAVGGGLGQFPVQLFAEYGPDLVAWALREGMRHGAGLSDGAK